jgi:hypothetical protein
MEVAGISKVKTGEAGGTWKFFLGGYLRGGQYSFWS